MPPRPAPHPQPGPSPVPPAQTVVAAALKYIGHPYVWGAWDCSGFVNHVFGVDLRLPIPGYGAGQYTGPPPHGPVVADWASFGGAQTVANPQPGDLVIWYWPGAPSGGHIGIYLGPNRMISALNSQLGTIESGITGNGPSANPSMYRRVTGAAGGTAPGGGPPGPGQQAAAAVGKVPVPVLLVLGGLGLLLLAGAVGAAGVLITAGGMTATRGMTRAEHP